MSTAREVKATVFPRIAHEPGGLYEIGADGEVRQTPRFYAGTASVTGSGTVALAVHGINTITNVVATLKDDAALTGHIVTATWSGTTVTLKVWKPTAVDDCTPIAAEDEKTVSYVVYGQ